MKKNNDGSGIFGMGLIDSNKLIDLIKKADAGLVILKTGNGVRFFASDLEETEFNMVYTAMLDDDALLEFMFDAAMNVMKAKGMIK